MSTLIFGGNTTWYRFKPGLFGLPQHALGIGVPSTDDVRAILTDMGFAPMPTTPGSHAAPLADRLAVVVDGKTVTLHNKLEGALVTVGETDFDEDAEDWNAALRQMTHVIVLVAPSTAFTNDFPDTLPEFQQLLSTVHQAHVPLTFR